MLSIRAYNALKRAQINSVEDLTGFRYEDLIQIEDIGSLRAEALMEALKKIDIQVESKSRIDSSPTKDSNEIPDPWI